MTKTTFRCIEENSYIFSAEEPLADIVFMANPDGTKIQYWRMDKGNVSFNEAPSISSFRRNLDIFFKHNKCGCCWFNLCAEELLWVERKLLAGEKIRKFLLSKAPDSAQSLLDAFKMTEITHPFISSGLGHSPEPTMGDDMVEICLHGDKRRGNRSRIKKLIKDQGLWEIMAMDDGDIKPYWRDEAYDPYYIQPHTLCSSKAFAHEASKSVYGVDISPLRFSYILMLLEAFEGMAGYLRVNSEGIEHLKAWTEADLHPSVSLGS